MEKWIRGLIPAEFTREGPGPTDCYRRPTEDHLELLVLKYGEGKASSPWLLRVQLQIPQDYDPDIEDGLLELRFPTMDELQEAVNTFLPEGCLVSFPQLVSMGPEAPAPDFSASQVVEIPISQVGALAGSAAARSSLILTPGGFNGSH